MGNHAYADSSLRSCVSGAMYSVLKTLKRLRSTSLSDPCTRNHNTQCSSSATSKQQKRAEHRSSKKATPSHDTDGSSTALFMA